MIYNQIKKTIHFFIFSTIVSILIGCGIYSFTGGNTGDAKTIQIDFFSNQAPLIEPGINQKFTLTLQDLFTRQTNLTLVNNNGDLHFQGEITDYRITPMSATANQNAAQNRLTISINVNFTNKLNEKDNFEKSFSFYSDFGANEQLKGEVLDSALEEIFNRICQNIFNDSVAKW